MVATVNGAGLGFDLFWLLALLHLGHNGEGDAAQGMLFRR
jgi:hypothetical protein